MSTDLFLKLKRILFNEKEQPPPPTYTEKSLNMLSRALGAALIFISSSSGLPTLDSVQAAPPVSKDAYELLNWLIPIVIAILISAIGLFTVIKLRRVNTFCRKYNSALDVPKSAVKKQKKIEGYVTKVVDGDTFRFFHQPILSFSVPKSFTAEDTINIRLAGVDCPETAHKGSPAQPLAEEAREWTLSRTMKKISDPKGNEAHMPSQKIRVQVLRVDQYGRLVATVWFRPHPYLMPFTWKNLSLDLVKQGLAVVYRGGGAVYGKYKKDYDAAEADAKKQGKGVWGISNFVRPDEFKKQLNQK